jgi:hypothetical protein
VDVLVLRPRRLDLGEPRLDLAQLVIVEDPRRVQTASVDERRRAVVREQLGVVAAQEFPHVLGKLAAGASGPQRHAGISFRSRAAASSTSIAASLMKP